ncbi:MAG: ATP-dependent Clp protease adapter protein ClpS [Phycisphaerae bacterium]|nr:ATP-dependent Clp protease adapter protein ClpS [Phycisphaerae bacterium]
MQEIETPQTMPAPPQTRRAPLWHVVLLDDDDHTYDYVIEMLCAIFRINPRAAFLAAREVDARGRVIVDTTVLERAEFKREQVISYGPDWRIERCKGSMSCVLEPATG